MVQWKMASYLKGNDPIGDTPIFDGTMIMGGNVTVLTPPPLGGSSQLVSG